MPPEPADRIHTLSPVLAGQIAAGEVIERPASVVKELLENSLDAGAGRIRIDIEAAGSRLIRVRDDGRGIHPDDLPLALAPHSTSKIRTAADLARITSLGFRGEALASIAAIARVRIGSRRGAETGHEIASEPGIVPAAAAPAAQPPGTVVEVCDLFFNLPARRKFLRSAQTEFLHIQELVRALSLSRPDLGLQLRHNGRQVFGVSAGADPIERIYTVFGRSFPALACHVAQVDGDLGIHGLAGRSEAARSQADRQYVFLNGRLIRDRRLNHALRMAYADRLPPGRYAPLLLYLEMDPAAYDINVHPTKHEVRFRHTRQIHDFLHSALRRALDENRPADGFVTPAVTAGSAPARAAEPSRGPYTVPPPAPADPPTAGRFGRPLGLVCGRYLLTAAGDCCWVIDYRQAAGRLAAARLKAALAAGPLPGRPLLVPESAPVQAAVMAELERAQETLRQYGIRLEAAGPDSVTLRELPAQYPAGAGLLAGLLELLQAAARTGGGVDAVGLIEVLARHAAGAAPDTPSEPEQQRCLQELDEAHRRGLLAAPWPWRRLDAAALAALLNKQS